MPAQTSGDMRQDDVAVIQLDGKRRARKNLFDAAEDLERRFFEVLRRDRRLCGTRTGLAAVSIASSYRGRSFAVEP